jgi:hypothetical protein
MVVLLVLNFRNSIIGASAWCPFGKCSAEALSTNATPRAQKLDKNDRNTLGGLQFVAKFLEVWFVFIATSLVYNGTMLLASRGRSLPIGFLMTHLEFTDLRMLFNCRFWDTAASPKGAKSSERPSKSSLYLFAFFVAFMCILANLMGPASAVLVLPALQWIDIQKQHEQRFDRTNLETGPTGDPMFSSCSAEMLAARQYSCTVDAHSSSLDSLVFTGASSLTQFYFNDNFGSGHVLGQERGIKYIFNSTGATTGTNPFWVPNRQLLQYLDDDLEELYNITDDRSSDHPSKRMYQNSLQTVLKRQGPIMEVNVNPYSLQNRSVTTITQDRQIRCYSKWMSPEFKRVYKKYTKCNRVGVGWNAANIDASFFIKEVNSSETLASVNAYFSDKSTYTEYVPESFPSSCVANGSAPHDGSCDWDQFFSVSNLPPDLNKFSRNILTVELRTMDLPSDQYVLFEFAVQSQFATYTLDSSWTTNPLHLVQVDGFVEGGDVIIHPDWFLAAWSVDQNGSVPHDRPAASGLLRGMEMGLKAVNKLADDNHVVLGEIIDPQTLLETSQLLLPVTVSFFQAMSMVTYRHSLVPSSASDNDPAHPILWRQKTIRVWAFGSNGRSSILAFVVVCLGILCVLVRTLLMCVTRSRQRSPTHLVVAALDYQPQGELAAVDIEDEKATSKVRYEMGDDERGRFHFRPVLRSSLTAGNSS